MELSKFICQAFQSVVVTTDIICFHLKLLYFRPQSGPRLQYQHTILVTLNPLTSSPLHRWSHWSHGTAWRNHQQTLRIDRSPEDTDWQTAMLRHGCCMTGMLWLLSSYLKIVERWIALINFSYKFGLWHPLKSLPSYYKHFLKVPKYCRQF